MTKDDDAAFPSDFGTHRKGMTLRDWFAGQALVGLIASPGTLDGETNKSPRLLAKVGYEIADAMLAARKDDRDGR